MDKIDNQYKYMGPMRYYKNENGFFIRGYDNYEKLLSDLRGNQIARKLDIAVPKIVSRQEETLTFREIQAPRIDQILTADNAETLFFNVGKLIAKLHRNSKTNMQPDLSLQQRKILDMQYILHSLQDCPDYFYIRITDTIRSYLNEIKLTTSSNFIHGDFTPQNIFVKPEEFIVFDWENSRYSDPAYDLASFISFTMQYYAKNELGFDDLIRAERKLIDGYTQIEKVTENYLRRYQFYKIFDSHTIYWYYLFLIAKIFPKMPGINVRNFFSKDLQEFESFITQVNASGFKLKATSLLRIHDMLQKNFSYLIEDTIEIPGFEIVMESR